MMRSLSLVLNFVMISSAAEYALSDSMDVGGNVFKASMRKRIFFVFSPATQTFSVFFESVPYYYYPLVPIFQLLLT